MKDLTITIRISDYMHTALTKMMKRSNISEINKASDINEFISDALTFAMEEYQKILDRTYPTPSEIDQRLSYLRAMHPRFCYYMGYKIPFKEFEAFLDYYSLNFYWNVLEFSSKEEIRNDDYWKDWLSDRFSEYFKDSDREYYPLEIRDDNDIPHWLKESQHNTKNIESEDDSDNEEQSEFDTNN
jgi:hypothetical protein